MTAVGIILAGGRGDGALHELTAARAPSAMPIGSCYRAIDFSLSNMTNSGINKVAVMAQYNSRSLQDHLNSSKWWDFGSKNGGLFIFTPFTSPKSESFFRGTADCMYQNINYLQRSNEEFVVIASGDSIYKADYFDFIDFHVEKNADITVVCKDIGDAGSKKFGVVVMDETGRITDFEEKPLDPLTSTISLGIYIIRRELLIEKLEKVVKEDGNHDFVRDVIMRYRKQMAIYGCMHEKYWASVNSVQSYYDINMQFLDRDIRNALYASEPYIETKPKDEPPAKYSVNSHVRNALVGSGSVIDGSVENSVMFRRVEILEKAHVRNSIVLEGCRIENSAVVEHAILDKGVVITAGQVVVGEPGNPKIVPKGETV